MHVAVVRIELSGGPVALGLLRDLSDQRRAEREREEARAQRTALEAQLRQAQKMEGLGQLAGGIAHDFNNLLTAIRGSASLALAELPPGLSAREDLELIEQSADRAAALTRQLLTFARRTVLQPVVVDLGAVVRRLQPMLGRLIGEDVELVAVTSAGAGFVLADPGQIEQVIINLAVNARDAMPKGGTLTIEVADVEVFDSASTPSQPIPTGPLTTISVTDTGIGMAADTLNHVFEPFFTTKGPGKGTGLGLATVYGIVHQSGGALAITSKPDQGSTFTVVLPRVEGAAEAGPEQPTSARGGRNRAGTILIAEDDGGVLRLASRVLETAGYRVLTASDGAMAIHAAKMGPVLLLLTDVIMPGMSGRDLAAQLDAVQPGIRVLYMSGHGDKGLDAEGDSHPEIKLLAKPFTVEALLAAVDEAVGRG